MTNDELRRFATTFSDNTNVKEVSSSELRSTSIDEQSPVVQTLRAYFDLHSAQELKEEVA